MWRGLGGRERQHRGVCEGLCPDGASLGMLKVGKDPLEARWQEERGCEEGEVPGDVQEYVVNVFISKLDVS